MPKSSVARKYPRSSWNRGWAVLFRKVISRRKLALAAMLLAAMAGGGCGGSGATKSFTLAVVPASVSLVPAGPAQNLVITASPVNGFTGTVSVSLGSLPAGVTTSPAVLSLTPGTLGQIAISASASAAIGKTSITLTGNSGTLSQTATTSLTVGPPASASLSASFFDFGNNLVNNSITQTVAAVTNTGTTALSMFPALAGDASYTMAGGAQSCGASLAPSASCNLVVTYLPTVASTPKTQNAVLNLNFSNASAATPQSVSITGTSGALSAGTVSATANPQVAVYSMTLPFPGSMTVNFGPTTAYGLKTWTQSTASAGGQVALFVAGMKGSTTYHMAATVQFPNGVTATDTDHTFTTGAVPAIPSVNLSLTTTATGGLTPQPGLELLDSLTGLFVTDLSGNVLWTYANPRTGGESVIQGVRLLENGDILMAIGANSGYPLVGSISSVAILEIREVNLAGDTVREISIDDLNSALRSATCAECHVTLQTFHHDVTPLPNGGWLVLANTLMSLSPATTPPSYQRESRKSARRCRRRPRSESSTNLGLERIQSSRP